MRRYVLFGEQTLDVKYTSQWSFEVFKEYLLKELKQLAEKRKGEVTYGLYFYQPTTHGLDLCDVSTGQFHAKERKCLNPYDLSKVPIEAKKEIPVAPQGLSAASLGQFISGTEQSSGPSWPFTHDGNW